MIAWLRIVACSSLLAAATASAAGINLSWNSCAGASAKAFACNTNAGTAYLFGSFVAPPGISALTGNEIVLDLQAASVTMPAWWDFFDAGACRPSALTISADGSTDLSGTCTDDWQGGAAAGIASYTALGSNRRRIVAVVSNPFVTDPLEADVEYFSFRLGISYAASTGAGSCAGCLTPVCLSLQSIKLVQPAGVGDVLLNNPASFNCAMWRNPTNCCQVSARNRTWGAVKALYR